MIATDAIFAALVHAGLLEESKGRFLAERARLTAPNYANFNDALYQLRASTRDELPDSPYKKSKEK